MDEKKEYIERGAVIDAIEGTDWYHISMRGNLVHGAISDGNALYKADDVFEVLNKLPAADVVEVVHGEWIIKTDYKTPVSHAYIRKEKLYICPYCAKTYRKQMNFCGNCGAIMDGKRKDGAEE